MNISVNNCIYKIHPIYLFIFLLLFFFYKIFPYVLLNIVILLFAVAISRCILIFSFKSARKLSKQSFFSCKQLLYPIYDLYGADRDGQIINIIKKVPFKGNKHRSGYMMCMVRKYGDKPKSIVVHRFIWECFNGEIPENKVIDHINGERTDNRLCNLQMMTQK